MRASPQAEGLGRGKAVRGLRSCANGQSKGCEVRGIVASMKVLVPSGKVKVAKAKIILAKVQVAVAKVKVAAAKCGESLRPPK